MRRRTLIHELVPAELRSPVLYLPVQFGPLLTALAAAVPQGTVAPPTGARHHVHHVPVSADDPDVPVHLYRPHAPTNEPLATVVFLHGGGFIAGHAENYHDWCVRLVQRLGVAVASVDYRLAPQHPYPAALDDAFAALTWVHAQADSLGLDPTRVAVAGDSAGGGLAATLAQRAHDAGVPVCFQALMYPMLDDRTCLHAPPHGHGAFVWTPASNLFAWTSYLGRTPGSAELPPYAAAARHTDLDGLPPAWIGVGGIDLFHDEDVTYAERLRAAGVPTALIDVPGMYHAADRFAPHAPSMETLIDSLIAALGRELRLDLDRGARDEDTDKHT